LINDIILRKILKLHMRPIIFFSIIIFLSSCVSNKKIVYLQDKSQKKSHIKLNDGEFTSGYVDYKVSKGDILSIQIDHVPLTELPDNASEIPSLASRSQIIHPYINGFMVNEKGIIDIPVLGELEVAGKSVLEIQQQVKEKADMYYSNPATKVFLLNFNVTVLGEVRMPGTFPVFNNSITVLEAIGMAGDMGEFADRNNIKIIRQINGKVIQYHIDLTDQNILGSEKFYLYPNDVIIIKPQRRKKYADKNLQLILTGKPDHNRLSDYYYKLSVKMGICEKILWVGEIPHSVVMDFYRECEIVVFPSLIESFGLPLLEAKSLRKFIFAMDLPYAKEILSDYKRCRLLKNDPQEWAEEIQKYYSDPKVFVSGESIDNKNNVDEWDQFIGDCMDLSGSNNNYLRNQYE